MLLMLWLPLQAASALAGCGGAASMRRVGAASTGVVPASHHATVADDAAAKACDEHAASGQGPGPDATAEACPHCLLCAVAAAPYVAGQGSDRSLVVARGEVPRHALPSIAASPPDLILRPPITAAA